MPPDPLEAHSFGSRLGKRSIFILDPRLSLNFTSRWSGAPNGNIVQNHLNIALLNYRKIPQNGKFTSNYKGSSIDFETQISLRR